jgi:hypothetical protein
MLHMKTGVSRAPCAHVYKLRCVNSRNRASRPAQNQARSSRNRLENGLANLILVVSGTLICLLGLAVVMGILLLGAELGGWIKGSPVLQPAAALSEQDRRAPTQTATRPLPTPGMNTAMQG